MFHHWTDVGWAMRVLDGPARERVPKENQTQNSRWLRPLSISIWYCIVLGHGRSIVLSAREEIVLLVGGCRIYQT